MRKQPLVSVVSIAYNQEKYIRAALDGMVMQKTDFDFEIIVADDCSTDTTPSIIQEYAAKYPDLIRTVLRKKNLGAIANSVSTLREATGKYVALCEGDDYWIDEHKLQKQVDLMEANPGYALCFHPIRVFFDDGNQEDSIWPSIKDKTSINIEQLLTENFIPTNAVMYRRQNYDHLVQNVMPFDWYLHAYHSQFGEIGFIDDVMSTYRRHEGGLWWEAHSNLEKHWKKYGLQQVSMFRELLRMYGKNEKLNAVICKSMGGLFRTVLKIDQKFAEEVLVHIAQESPVALTNLVVNLEEEIEEKTDLLDKKKHKLVESTNEVLSLRTEVFHLRDEIQSLRNSRVLGRIIKTRDVVGEARKQATSLPRRTVHKVRVVGAPLVPARVRKRIKAVYKRAKSIDRNQTVKVLSYKPWDISKPLVSVVIPYFNRADTIDDTLQSLDWQTFIDFEVLLVDDGSTDVVSIDKLADLKQHTLNITVIRQANQGVAAARNTGISQAQGKYVICLDSDDMLDPTYIEKAVALLETQPDVAIATSWMDVFGVKKERYKNIPYNPLQLYKNNMVVTAGAFRKDAWEKSGGYKSGIGYEDWDFWLTLGEHGFWGKLIPEALFLYRTSMQSRYVEDKDVHWNNMKKIRDLHPKYVSNVKRLLAQRRQTRHTVEPANALINLSLPQSFKTAGNNKPNVLITVPWMTFGGAETLIYNYCREIKEDFNITFVTGLLSDHEWEYKFKEITPNVYHLANLFDDEALRLEFIANYIKTRNIQLLHVIHNGFTFKMIPELKKRFPDLKVAVTMFNDRVEYFEQSIGYAEYIDNYISDNSKVAKNYQKQIGPSANTTVVPNGINCYEEFSPSLFDREKERATLGLDDRQLGIFFVGRLSEEKNPDVFVEVAEKLLKSAPDTRLKFFVIGDGPMRAEIEQMIKRVNSPSILYLGYQSEVARYFSAADIFVLPSSIEGFPLSILEAMAMRVVVVASDVGAVAEVVENNKEGFVVSPGSVDEIADALLVLSKDHSKLANMKKSARKKVEAKYSNRILGSNYKKLYKSLTK